MKNKTKHIVNFLNKQFPFKKAESWDKVGKSYGDLEKPVNIIVVALDLTKEVFDEAINSKADLIITHHPFIFSDDKKEEFRINPYKKELNKRLLGSKIGLVSLHTNYDYSKEGMSYQILKKLGVKGKLSNKCKYAFVSSEKATSAFVSRLLDEKFGTPFIEKNWTDAKNYDKWAILPGAASPEDLLAVSNEGAQFIVTSDVKWSTWIFAKEMNIKLASISHRVESVFVDHITKILKKEFDEIIVKAVHIKKEL